MTKKEFEVFARATMERALAEYGGVAGCLFLCVSPKGRMNTFIGGSPDKIVDGLATAGADAVQVANLLRASIRRMNRLKRDRMFENIEQEGGEE